MNGVRCLAAAIVAAFVLASAPAGAQTATGVFVAVEDLVLPLLGADRRPTGAVRVDFSIEAGRPEDAALIQALMPRVRDALLTRIGPLSAAGLNLTADQIEEARRQILLIVRQSVGTASVAAIHFRRVLAYPA
jgi:hypothetical protein